MLFQNLVELTLFVELGTKMNSVYKCDYVLEQGLLPDITV